MVAGETGTWILLYTVGPGGIAVGGSLRVFFDIRDIPYLVSAPGAGSDVLFPCTMPRSVLGCARQECGSPWRTRQPRSICPQLITASTSGVSRLELSAGCLKVMEVADLAADYEPGASTYGYRCDVTVQGAPLVSGDAVKIVFGDEDRGLPGFRAPINAMDAFRLWVLVDTEGDGAYRFLASPCVVRVSPGAAASLRLSIPSTGSVGAPNEVALSAFDVHGNVCRAYDGEVTLDRPAGATGLPAEYAFTPGDGGTHVFSGVSFAAEGTYTVSARDSAVPGVAGRSNPFRCTAERPPLNVYWGDLHGHTGLSDGGERTPEDYYLYARDVARLDFCALTDHSWCVMRDDGEATVRRAATAFYQPGRFVTLFGYECTHLTGAGGNRCGHRNVYHLDLERHICNTDAYFPSRCTRDVSFVEQLWSLLEGTDALVIPHGGVDWDLYHRGMEGLVEIYSKWGSRETYGCETPDPDVHPGQAVQDALARGYRLGFVGGSDTHCARPGDLGPGALLQYPSGLTAVYAEELTRGAIWRSLLQRHTYATTGEKILLSFTMGGRMMGEAFVTTDDPVARVDVVGTEEIEAIDLIEDGSVIYGHTGTGVHEQFELQIDLPAGTTRCYYVRVRQRDTARAWSSPVWVTKDAVG